MKKLLFSTIITLAIIAGYGQKEVPEVIGKSFTFESPLPGNQSYNYKASEFIKITGTDDSLFGYQPNSGKSFHAVTDPLMVIATVPGETGGPNPGDDGLVGAIPGKLSVGSNGSANYQIPIEALPGINGMVPNISLVYNSNAGNGVMGMRWNVAGLSAIQRTGTNIYHEGFVDGVDFDENDKLMLNGNRLIAVGTNEYRTEIETFSKIEAKEVSNGWPDWFEVFTKSGYIYEYGNSDDSRIEAPGRDDVIAWKVNKISDRKGNAINFNYVEEDGVARISNIEYANDGTGAVNNIQFFYSTERIDTIINYMAGCKFEINKLLDSIQVNYLPAQTAVRTYVMDYDTTGLYSRLSHITLWDEGRIKHFNPTAFNYGIPKTAFKKESTNINANKNADIVTGDFDGDGKTDVVAAFYDISSEAQEEKEFTSWSVYYSSNTEGNFFIEDSIGVLPDNFSHFIVLDFNGDGFDDLVEIHDTYYSFRKSTGTSFDNSVYIAYYTGYIENRAEFQPADFNGNGLNELLLIRKINLENRNTINRIQVLEFDGLTFKDKVYDENGTPGFNFVSDEAYLYIKPGDFNGDGKTDLLIETEYNESKFYTLNESQQILELLYDEDFTFPNRDLSSATLTGDFNGDGITDLITKSKTSPPHFTVRLLNGKDAWINQDVSISFPQNGLNHIFDYYYNYMVADFNGDNHDDILLGYAEYYKFNPQLQKPDSLIGRYWDIYYSNGSSVKLESHFMSGGLQFHPNLFDSRYAGCDFNGDGSKDNFIFDNGFTGAKQIVFFHKNEQVNHIQKFINGLGAETKISYEPITNNDIYTKGDIDIEKVKNIQNTMHVVDTVWRDDGLGGWFTQTYLYEGASYHHEGKGFLGFSTTYNYDLSTGMYSVRYSEINPEYFIPYLYRERSYSGSTLLSEKNMEYSLEDFGSSRIFFYNKFAQTNIHSTGDVDSDYVKTIRRIINFSSDDILYGNVSTDSTFVDEAEFETDAPVENFNYYTINNYTYNYESIDDWMISRPEQQTVTKKSPDEDTEYHQEYNYTYYGSDEPQYPLLESFSYIPGNFSQFQVNTNFDYDDFGNVTSETISAPNYSLTPIEVRITEYDYSQAYNYRFLTQTTKTVNGTDFIQTNQYYGATGLTESTTDINNQTTSYVYDGFGRLIKTVQPNGVETHSILRWNIFPDPEHAVYYHWQKTSGTPAVFVFLDKLGRDHKTWANNFDDQTVIADKYYYSEGSITHGKLFRETEPYFPGDIPLENEYQYLPTGQLKWLIGPAATTKFTYNGRTTVTENTTTGQSRSQTVNAIGQLSVAEDPCGTVEYFYKSSGQPSEIQKNTGGLLSAIEISYDDAGFKDVLSDPDAGEFLFDYNPYGELVSQTNARGFTYKMLYDALGRMTERTLPDPMQTTTYTYDGENALGLISSITGHNGISENYQYNGNVQLISKTETIDGVEYVFNYEYDVFGRLKEETWPTGFSVNYKYRNGYLGKVVDKQSGKVLWELNAINARNQVLEFALGNSLSTTHGYDEYGFPTSITTSNNIQNLSYGFDKETGNLNWRKDKTDPGNILEEVFGYDDKLKSRLTSWIVTNGDSHGIDYLDNGNIDLKTDVGDYTYDVQGQTGGPHALKKIEDPEEEYLQNAPTQNVTYTPFDKVAQISHPTEQRRLNLTYGPGNMRKITRLYQTDDVDGDILLKTKYFIGGNYEIEEYAGGNQRKLHYLSASTGLFAIFVQDNNGEHMYYIHKDYLGSFQSVTNEDGELLERYAFDPWGRRRNPNDWSFTDVPENFLFDRGYTGHEHLDDFDLINMNGRVYDPFVARFLSPDPFVSNPTGTQGFNRYSYVVNNPLKFVDPSGYQHGNHPMTAPITVNSYAYNVLGSGPMGPGSGNHWSDEYRGEHGNFMLMNNSTFDNTYGEGSFDKAVMINELGLTKSWSAGEFSLADASLIKYEWNPLGGAEVMRKAYTESGASYLDIYYEGSWTLVGNKWKTIENGDVWFYGVQRDNVGDVGHSLVRTPDGIIYEINHPNNGRTNGKDSWIAGGPKAVGYRYDMNRGQDFVRFWNFGDGREMITWQAVYVPNPASSVDFFESWVGRSWDYNFFTNNCKHYIDQGLSTGGATIRFNANVPTEWPGAYSSPWYNPF